MTLNDLERRNGRCIALFHWLQILLCMFFCTYYVFPSFLLCCNASAFVICAIKNYLLTLGNLRSKFQVPTQPRGGIYVRVRVRCHVRYLISCWVSCLIIDTALEALCDCYFQRWVKLSIYQRIKGTSTTLNSKPMPILFSLLLHQTGKAMGVAFVYIKTLNSVI